ncbi:PulJ/GspJ family protein [Marinobacterium lutimaris]|uniref:Prepilin-type N-terminal cleavage/methylation domain-containing protein n=1 Tax=Marinobacterium lutimaris TaxID=568106 RepID=A0A1H5X0L1_9GAMM|nr:prepilin-type N-terminal cleavage/methylation domain-containing protein [Marinobacterium lutimaris]SEG04920.1 prepilin-type N-terminal cleavage/methylation domain-containing protein [Marinobacterium lutimaris]
MSGITERGFTLIELLMALVLTALVMLLLFTSLRIGARSWEVADTRQQQIAEQYQLQQFLRRLISQARDARVRDRNGQVQVAFRGERDQLIFVAPSNLGSGDSSLLWYRLRVSEATADRPRALMLETSGFQERQGIDWAELFDASLRIDAEGNELSPPREYLLGITGEAELEFSYVSYDSRQLEEERGIWLEEAQLPTMIEVSLKQSGADPSQGTGSAELAGWNGMSVLLQEFSHGLRTD